MALLEVEGLHTVFRVEGIESRVVNDVSFELEAGAILGLVGESGCGKSATCMSILGLLPKGLGSVSAGSVRLQGKELLKLSDGQMAKIRGTHVGMIFQDPMTSLNPYMTVEEQLVEVPMLHRGLGRDAARALALDYLERVRIPEARARLSAYPHELSGGMRQRVMIAMALVGKPDLLIADEPTTALDVTTQRQILELLLSLKEDHNLGVILITHDLGVVSEICDDVAVMYAGRLLETGPVRPVLDAPGHPYTDALLRSLPDLHRRREGGLVGIDGLPPRLDQGGIEQCTFAPRCGQHVPACWQREPDLVALTARRRSRCPETGGTS